MECSWCICVSGQAEAWLPGRGNKLRDTSLCLCSKQEEHVRLEDWMGRLEEADCGFLWGQKPCNETIWSCMGRVYTAVPAFPSRRSLEPRKTWKLLVAPVRGAEPALQLSFSARERASRQSTPYVACSGYRGHADAPAAISCRSGRPGCCGTGGFCMKVLAFLRAAWPRLPLTGLGLIAGGASGLSKPEPADSGRWVPCMAFLSPLGACKTQRGAGRSNVTFMDCTDLVGSGS